jgi:dihydroorotase
MGVTVNTRPTAFLNARLVDPASGRDEPGALLVADGIIKSVLWGEPDPTPPEGTQIVEARGHVLAPGLIDGRVFVGEPGAEHKETLASASRAAAAGGVTTMIVMPETDPVIDDAALVDFIKRRARDTAEIHVHPMAALSRGLKGEVMTEMGLLKEAGAVGFTDGTHAIANAQVMRRAMSYSTLFDALIAHQPEDPALAAGAAMNEGELSTRLGLVGVPKAAETIMLARDLALVRLTGARYHAALVSCAESLALIAAAKDEGLAVTCAVAAHHLALNENDIGSYRTYLKVRPPLRAEEDRRALSQGVADGIIDLVVSAHQPQAPEDKRLPFAEASDGCIGLETLLPALLERVHGGEIGLLQALAAVTINPARLFGLESGKLVVGASADLVLIDLGRPFVLRLADLHSKCRNTPFEDHRFQGAAAATYVSGRRAFAQAVPEAA